MAVINLASMRQKLKASSMLGNAPAPSLKVQPDPNPAIGKMVETMQALHGMQNDEGLKPETRRVLEAAHTLLHAADFIQKGWNTGAETQVAEALTCLAETGRFESLLPAMLPPAKERG